jgi:hypothetical protein
LSILCDVIFCPKPLELLLITIKLMSLETVEVVRRVEILNFTEKTILVLTALFLDHFSFINIRFCGIAGPVR